MILAWNSEIAPGPGDEDEDENPPADDPGEGFDEDPDSVDLTPPIDQRSVVFSGPGDEDDDDEGFDEEPDLVERDDEPEETR